MNNRRSFIKKISFGTGMMAIHGVADAVPGLFLTGDKSEPLRISRTRRPLAIAMWDYSWILRHHRYGEFENWDYVLEGLANRGYNAIRIDAMPQFVVSDISGKVETEFRSVKDGWKPSLWGNDYTMSFRPREALLEFIPKCVKYGIKVGLATWFMRHGTGRRDIFMEEGGLLRAWDETLAFLGNHNLLDQVIYVDLLNEYPNWHGYDWFLNKMSRLTDPVKSETENPVPNLTLAGDLAKPGNSRQREFYNHFISSTINTLKLKYPDIDFFASLDSAMDLDLIDLSCFNALDYHIWFAHTNKIPGLREVSSLDQTQDLRKVYAGMMDYWKENKESLIGWMDERLTHISATASRSDLVCGNTEGWGPIFWIDHPELDWNWVKECAEICVDLALRHDNYKFICTSNFTHPQFKGMWEDLKWHQKITARIKAG
jgi:hypothetical protein